MAFGKNLSQQDAKYTPQPNNYCGGFTMSAILTDFFEKDYDPMAVYGEIQRFQQDVSSGSLFNLIELMKQYGSNTNICLPSSLVNIARETGFVVNLKYSDSLGFDEDAIQAEVERCKKGVAEKVGTEDIFDCFSDQKVKYYLVMVNNCHWIAVKRKTKGDGFSVYDPGISTNYDPEVSTNTKFDGIESMTQDWAQPKYSAVGALIITLTPQTK